MKLKELQKFSKEVRIILIGLFALGFSLIIVMLTGIILFNNDLMNTLQFIVFEAFCMAMLGVVSVVFDLFKDLNSEIQMRLNKILKRLRAKKHAQAQAKAEEKARIMRQQSQDMIAAMADIGHATPNLQIIDQNKARRRA